MTLVARNTMSREETARWRQQMQLGPPLDPDRFAEKQAWKEQRTPQDPWRRAYDAQYRAGEQMALVLEGLTRDGHVNRKAISDALHAWRQCAKGDA